MFSSKLATHGSVLAKALPKGLSLQALRWASVSTLKVADLEVELTKAPKPKIHHQVTKPEEIAFGKHFSDHMLVCDWSAEDGWARPKIMPYGDFSIAPGTSCLHYAIECFEGLKAYRGDKDGKIRLFRPMENMRRLNNSAVAASLPEVDGEGFMELIKELIRIDHDWVPSLPGCSLYIRPTYIGTQPFLGVSPSQNARLFCITCPVGPYFPSGLEPVSLYADPQFVRAWPGGTGDNKMGGNYAPTLRVQKLAKEVHKCEQVLWLFGEDNQLTEVGTMNIFVDWINENGEPEIATPPLDGTILPGVTRKSLLELGATWGTHKVVERIITMEDIRKSVKNNTLKEVFGAGTACVVSPVNRILFLDENIPIPAEGEVSTRFYNELMDIQNIPIPAEGEVSTRFYNELMDIQNIPIPAEGEVSTRFYNELMDIQNIPIPAEGEVSTRFYNELMDIQPIPIPVEGKVSTRFYNELMDIQYGRKEHEWCVVVD